MTAALALAERGLGAVWPNPAVGCVLVNDGRVVGRGWTQAGGRPHAEIEALARAGNAAKGATAYVTLEPCAHHGKTGPCAEALAEAGIARLVAAMADPDGRVAGRGFAHLEAAGIEISVGLGGAEAARLNAGFLRRIESGRPLVTLKLATSMDGRIATHSGDYGVLALHNECADVGGVLVGSLIISKELNAASGVGTHYIIKCIHLTE